MNQRSSTLCKNILLVIFITLLSFLARSQGCNKAIATPIEKKSTIAPQTKVQGATGTLVMI